MHIGDPSPFPGPPSLSYSVQKARRTNFPNCKPESLVRSPIAFTRPCSSLLLGSPLLHGTTWFNPSGPPDWLLLIPDQPIGLVVTDLCAAGVRTHLIRPGTSFYLGFPGDSDSKESTCNVEDPGSIPGSGRCPGEGNGYPLQYSCLENPTDRGA